MNMYQGNLFQRIKTGQYLLNILSMAPSQLSN